MVLSGRVAWRVKLPCSRARTFLMVSRLPILGSFSSTMATNTLLSKKQKHLLEAVLDSDLFSADELPDMPDEACEAPKRNHAAHKNNRGSPIKND